MLFKKVFTDWRKGYAVFWVLMLFTYALFSVGNLITGYRFSGGDYFGMVIFVGLAHIFFIGLMSADDREKQEEMLNHTYTLAEFTEKYGLTDEQAFQLLKEGKVEGMIAFKSYSLLGKTKEDVQQLTTQEGHQ